MQLTPVRAVRTMKSDAEEFAKREQASFIDLVAEEAKLREQARPQIRIGRAPKKSHTKIILITGAFLIIAGSGAGTYFFLFNKTTPAQPQPTDNIPKAPRPIINAQKMELLKIQKDDRTGLILEIEKGLERSKNDTNFWYLPILVADAGRDAHFAKADEFFKTLRISVPTDDFWNGTREEWNLYGYGEDLVLVFAMRDKPTLYGAMLSWERILPQQFATIIRGAKATPRMFTDKIMKDTDVRIAYLPETNGKAVAWALVSEKFLAMATSEKAMRTTIDRLLAE